MSSPPPTSHSMPSPAKRLLLKKLMSRKVRSPRCNRHIHDSRPTLHEPNHRGRPPAIPDEPPPYSQAASQSRCLNLGMPVSPYDGPPATSRRTPRRRQDAAAFRSDPRSALATGIFRLDVSEPRPNASLIQGELLHNPWASNNNDGSGVTSDNTRQSMSRSTVHYFTILPCSEKGIVEIENLENTMLSCIRNSEPKRLQEIFRSAVKGELFGEMVPLLTQRDEDVQNEFGEAIARAIERHQNTEFRGLDSPNLASESHLPLYDQWVSQYTSGFYDNLRRMSRGPVHQAKSASNSSDSPFAIAQLVNLGPSDETRRTEDTTWWSNITTPY